MAIELEIKFSATEKDLERMKKELPGEEKSFSMETTYYDTPRNDLSRRRITLRRRMENESSVCTLKAPAETGRLEFELECDSIEAAIPKLCKLAPIEDLPSLLEKGVVPVCGARFTRLAKTLVFQDSTIEVALDQGILTGGDKEIPLCEVEFELKSGSEAQLRQFAAVTAAAYGLTPERRSKFARANALAKGE